MKILVACEESQTVCKAFRARGHEAYSCDIVECSGGHPEWHLQQDVIPLLKERWDMVIAFPPCTYLCSMGVWWNHKRPERWPLTLSAMEFVKTIWECNSDMVAIENPVGYLSKNWKKPSQIIQPWMFGHEANKPTCLWLRGLPLLTPTNIVGKGKFYTKSNGQRMSAWSHVTSGTRKAERAKIASKTFEGIATAMADQWIEPLWPEEFAHRAAILEYDGGFTRAEAEEEAGYWVSMQKREWEKRHEQS